MSRPYAEYERFLTAVLRGEVPPWPPTATVELMLQVGDQHGVNALVEAANRGKETGWPEQYTNSLTVEAQQQTGHEILRRRELQMVLKGFADAGLHPLILKGAALAYNLYPSPVVRPRCDIDLLVTDADRDACDLLLLELGYERGLATPGSLISHEQCYFRKQAGFMHLVDLHWKINNRKVLARTFSYDELIRNATPVVPLGEAALTLSAVHAVLLACMHRVASLCTQATEEGLEHFDGDRLIWLYDLHLLCGNLTESEWRRLIELSVEKGIVTIVRDGLHRCRALFGTTLAINEPEFVAVRHELSAGLIDATPRQAFINDLRCLNWTERLGFVRQTVLPSSAYMRRRYGDKRPLLLQYLSRAAAGYLRSRGHR